MGNIPCFRNWEIELAFCGTIDLGWFQLYTHLSIMTGYAERACICLLRLLCMEYYISVDRNVKFIIQLCHTLIHNTLGIRVQRRLSFAVTDYHFKLGFVQVPLPGIRQWVPTKAALKRVLPSSYHLHHLLIVEDMIALGQVELPGSGP